EYTDLYIGDTMLFGNLTLQAGVRYDDQHTNIFDAVTETNPTLPDLLPSVSLPAEAFGPQEDYQNISPRLGLTYALGEDRSTLLRAAYNQYVDQLGGGTNNFSFGYSYLYMYFADANHNRIAEREEILFDYGIGAFYGVNPDDPTAAIVSSRFDPDLEAQTTDEIILGVEREILPQFTVGLNYTHREVDNFTHTLFETAPGSGDFFGRDDYVFGGTVETTLPDGRVVTNDFFELRDGLQETWGFITNRDGYSQEYDGIELTAVKRLSNRWMLRGNVSWNDWTQNVDDQAIIDPTLQRSGTGCSICDGSDVVEGSGSGSGSFGGVYINSGWSFVLTGLYQIPVIETNFGVNISGREGYPIPYVHRVSASEARKFLLVDGVTDNRHDDPILVDLRLSKDFQLGGVGLNVGVDAFNITNEQTVLQRRTELARSGRARPNANEITEMISPRIFRVGVRLSF
ncbi:MAG: hypothetical protein ACRD2J_14015, partial [Thermoanaerobaculia bacterium]